MHIQIEKSGKELPTYYKIGYDDEKFHAGTLRIDDSPIKFVSIFIYKGQVKINHKKYDDVLSGIASELGGTLEGEKIVLL